MPRILVVSNIPTPYQVDFLGELSTHCALKAVFLWPGEANRDWTFLPRDWMSILGGKDNTSRKKEMQALLKSFAPEVVIVGGYRLPLAQWLRRYSKNHGARFFYWLEKPLPTSGWRVFARQLVWCMTLPFAHGVIAVGSQASSIYKRYARHIFTMPYAINPTRYAQREGMAAQPLRVLFVGQFIPRKGITELLEAFAFIPPEKAILSMVGSGEQKALIEAAAAHQTHIRLLGFMEPDMLAAEFAKHDIFVLPSRHDGWAVVVAEAMAAALPVIGTKNTGAFVDLVKEECGRLCEVTADSIRMAIEYYIAHPEEVARQGANARQHLLQSRAVAQNASHDLLAMLAEAPYAPSY